MKIVIAGDWHSAVHEEPVHSAFVSLGHDVSGFNWHRYFSGPGLTPLRAFRKAQNKFLFGPACRALNNDLVSLVSREQPSILFVYRGTHVTKETLQAIGKRSPATILVGYNNDDPFSPAQPAYLWRHFVAALPAYDLVLAYRERNIADFLTAGAQRVELLRSWFVPERHQPVALSRDDVTRYGADVVFIGHYESDGRLQLLEALARAGLAVRIFGPGHGFRGYDWDAMLARSPYLRHLAPVSLVWDDEYAKALCGSKMALCFFSRLNRDTYTRRCFEIPATGTLLLSEYSDDLATMFEEGREAEFFRSSDELVRKATYYSAHDDHRRAVAEAGLRRVHVDGHDVQSRMRHVLAWAADITAQKASTDKGAR